MSLQCYRALRSIGDPAFRSAAKVLGVSSLGFLPGIQDYQFNFSNLSRSEEGTVLLLLSFKGQCLWRHGIPCASVK